MSQAKKPTKNETYWRDRAMARENKWFSKAGNVERALKREYEYALIEIQTAINSLYARFSRDNKMSYHDAQKLIRSNEFQKWRMDMAAYLRTIEKAQDDMLLLELNTLAMRSRISRLDYLHAQAQLELHKLAGKQDARLHDFLTEAFQGNYYHNLFDIQKAIGISLPVAKLSQKRIETILRFPWSGEQFSKRIWDNTKRLSNVLKREMVQGFIQGINTPKMAKRIADKMGADYQRAVTLVRTELTYVSNQASLESVKDAGGKKYIFIATLDSRTSPPCRELDRRTFPVEKGTPGDNMPPMHPRCRSATAMHFDGDYGRRIARNADGKTIYVPENMNYESWKKVYVDKEQSLKNWVKENPRKITESDYPYLEDYKKRKR